MATKITTCFSYNGKDPIDGPRSKFSSVTEMKNYNEAFIDEGHMSIANIGTAQAPVWKRFEWFSANTVDSTYGRWRAVTTEIPLASSSTIGGIKIGFDSSQSGFNPDLDIPVELAQGGKAYVTLLDATSTSRGVVLKTSYTVGPMDLTDDESVPTVKATKAIADNAANSAISNKIWTGTQAQYDAIVTKDATVLYFITES
jgi:hypothetical protein